MPTAPLDPPGSGAVDPTGVPGLGSFLAARIPPERATDLPPAGSAAPRFDLGGPIADAARAITEAVLASRDGLPPDFRARTRAPLATLVGGWRRADLPESDFTGALTALGDAAVDDLAGDDERPVVDRARGAAAILDATLLLIRRSQRTFRSWRERSRADEAFSVAVFGEALSHEIRNRIHAAHTALELLHGGRAIADADRARLQQLLKNAVVAARRAVFDVRLVTADDPDRQFEINAPLHEILRHTVARHRVVSDDAGITIEFDDTVPTVHVDARRVQVILNNMLDVATRLVAAAGGTTVRMHADRPPEGQHLEIRVEGDAPFLRSDHVTLLLEADLVDTTETTDPAQLGLWLTREAATSIGGDLAIMHDPAGRGAALVARIPTGHPRDPSS